MKISIIGSGNCASVLGNLFVTKGHSILQVIGRNLEHTKDLAEKLNAEAAHISQKPDPAAEFFLVAVSDSSLRDAMQHIRLDNVPVAHTAGALPMNVLGGVSENYGVLYPLQTFRKEMKEIPEVPFLIEGNNEHMRGFLENFAGSLGSVKFANGEERLRLHAAAVIVNNFTNYLYSIAQDFCEKEKVDFNLLKPLIKETAHRIIENQPADVQTGPAVRKDITTLDKHLRLFTPYPKLRTMYLRMTDSIMNP